MKGFRRTPGALSTRPEPRTNLFHLLLCRRGDMGWVLGEGFGNYLLLLLGLLFILFLGSWLLMTWSPQGDEVKPSSSKTSLIPLHLNFSPTSFSLLSSPLPLWASELDCLPFGFPRFLPSSVPLLIAPLFLTSQGCQLSGHSWKIHLRRSNCKQIEKRERRGVGGERGKIVWELNLQVIDRKQNKQSLNHVYFSLSTHPASVSHSSLHYLYFILFYLIFSPSSINQTLWVICVLFHH